MGRDGLCVLAKAIACAVCKAAEAAEAAEVAEAANAAVEAINARFAARAAPSGLWKNLATPLGGPIGDELRHDQRQVENLGHRMHDALVEEDAVVLSHRKGKRGTRQISDWADTASVTSKANAAPACGVGKVGRAGATVCRSMGTGGSLTFWKRNSSSELALIVA